MSSSPGPDFLPIFEDTLDEERSADPRVLRLLVAGIPNNGINLVPWWQENAGRLNRDIPIAKSGRWYRQGLRFLAVGVLGVLFGGVGMGMMTNHSRSPENHYSPMARHAMFEVMDAPAQQRAELASQYQATLAGCTVCHVGLRGSFGSPRQPRFAGRNL